MWEPCAAGLTYEVKAGRLLVLDVGAGTTDAALVDVGGDGGPRAVRVRGKGFGGDDVDEVMGMAWGEGGWRDVKHRLCGRRRWVEEAEGDGLLMGDYVEPEDSVEVSEGLTVTRKDFEDLVEWKVLPTIVGVARECLKGEGCDGVALVGGGSNLPGLVDALKELRPGMTVLHDVNPFLAVGLGDAIQGGIGFERTKESDVRRGWEGVVAFDVGVGVGEEDWVPMLKRDLRCPAKGEGDGRGSDQASAL